MILQEYIKIKNRWEISTCWEDSPMSVLLENESPSNLIPFWKQREASLEYYNRMIKTIREQIKREIEECEKRLKLIIKSKSLKEIRKIEKLTAIYIHSNDLDTIKGQLIIWYKTKIRNDKRELDPYSRSWCETEIL